jgi:hypothetical protein
MELHVMQMFCFLTFTLIKIDLSYGSYYATKNRLTIGNIRTPPSASKYNPNTLSSVLLLSLWNVLSCNLARIPPPSSASPHEHAGPLISMKSPPFDRNEGGRSLAWLRTATIPSMISSPRQIENESPFRQRHVPLNPNIYCPSKYCDMTPESRNS